MADGKIVIKIDMVKSDFENNGDKVIKINVNTNGSDENEEELKTAAESEAGGRGDEEEKEEGKEKTGLEVVLVWLFSSMGF